MENEYETYWVCSTCGRSFEVEGNGRVHLSIFNHGVLYHITRKVNPSRRDKFDSRRNKLERRRSQRNPKY